MNIIDIGIIIFILFGGILGFKRGFTREIVSFVGVVLALIIAYMFKNTLANFFFNHLPFFKFGGILKGVTALNILVYEILAFFIVFSLLQIVLRILTIVTSIFEKILNATIILGIPSKILGLFVGFIENYLIVFVVLFCLSLPFLNINLSDSRYSKKILNNTPFISSMSKNTVNVIDEFTSLKKKYQDSSNANEFNLETIDLFLKYNVVTKKEVENLISNNKLKINGIENVLNKY